MNKNLFTPAIIALGFGFFGFIVQQAIDVVKYRGSYISTNGISVKHVVSDDAVWNLNVVAEANTAQKAQEVLQEQKRLVLEYLKNSGFTENEISEEPIVMSDNFKYSDYSKDSQKARFSAIATFHINSQNLDLIKSTSLKITDLTGLHNINLAENNIRYLYKGMDKLRIEMIKEATEDSKNRAEKIAETLNIKLTGVRNIATGKFSIRAEDARLNDDWDEGESALKKQIRVVVHGSFNLGTGK